MACACGCMPSALHDDTVCDADFARQVAARHRLGVGETIIRPEEARGVCLGGADQVAGRPRPHDAPTVSVDEEPPRDHSRSIRTSSATSSTSTSTTVLGYALMDEWTRLRA